MDPRGQSLIALAWACSMVATAQNAPQQPSASDQARMEDAVIEANRKGAKPRPISPGKGLSREDRERARVFQDAKKSVVYINASTNRVVIRDVDTGNEYRLPPGTGTGFVWDNLGHVVTNHHVIRVENPATGAPLTETENIEIRLSNGRNYKARLIGRSLEYDIAVLHVFAPLADLKPLPLGASNNLAVGQGLLAIGNPFGLDHTMTSGIVSALGRTLPTSFGTLIKGVIQTDAAINPGNSGGPLLDWQGRLVGMNTAIPSATGANVGVGFAIPADTLNRVVPELIAKGNTQRQPLGFVSMSHRNAMNVFGIEHGIVVESVEPGSAADRAGLKGLKAQGEGKPLLGDVIVGFQGKPLATDVLLLDRLDLIPPGTPLVFDVLRDGVELKITIRPWEEAAKPANDPI